MMLASPKDANGWMENSTGHGTSIYTVNSDGVIHITKWATSSEPTNSIYLKFKKPISLSPGDVVSAKIIKKSGTDATLYSYGYLHPSSRTWNIWSNVLLANLYGNTYSYTTQSAITIDTLWIRNGTRDSTMSLYLNIEIYINGERVI